MAAMQDLVLTFCPTMHCIPQRKLELLTLLKRVPNRFFGIRDLAYFKAGIPDCNFHRDTGLDDFNRRESGNVTLKKPRFGNSRD